MGSLGANGRPGWGRLLAAQAERHPEWEAGDLYKLAHQATRGSEHAAPSEAAVWERLEAELREVGPGPAEPLVDPIRPDGALVRVHLRPWQAARLDPGLLLEAFLGTAECWPPSIPELEAVLRWALEHSGRLGLDGTRLKDLTVQMREAGYPAAHHSEAYRIFYRPAYRVVATRFLPPELVPGGGR